MHKNKKKRKMLEKEEKKNVEFCFGTDTVTGMH